MAKEILDTGTVANDNTGDTLRQGGSKINQNFSEVYNALSSDGTNITFDVNTLSLDTLIDVDLTTPAAVDQYLQFNGSRWVPVTHEVDGAVTGHLIPDANVTYDLGSPTLAFRDLYLSSSSIHLGGLKLSANTTTGLVLESNGVPLTPDPIDYDSLANKPTLVTSFNELADQPAIPAGDLSTANNAQTLENKTLGSSSPTHIDGDLLPTRDIQFDLGSSTNRFRDLYLSSSSMHIGGTKLSTAGGSLQTFDVVYNGKLRPSRVQDWNSFQYDGNPRKTTIIESPEVAIPYVVDAPHGAAKIEDGYEARLIARLSQPVDIFKKYPNIEQYEEVNERFCSTADPENSDDWFKTAPWVFSDFNNVLHITVYELEAGTKYKLVYKFMTGDWPVDVDTTLCEWIITRDSLGTTKYHATANSKKINTHYYTEFDTKFAFYDVDGNLDPTAIMFVDGIGIENSLSFASGNVPSTLTTNPFISGDANSAPLFGSHLQHSYLQISGPNGFFVNGKGDTMGYRPPVANNIADLHFFVEPSNSGTETFLRVYGTEQFGTPTQINPAHPATDYDLNSAFLTEFRFTQATTIDEPKLVPTSKTRPIAWGALDKVQTVEYHDKTVAGYAANSVIYFGHSRCFIGERRDVTINDMREFFDNNESKAKIIFDTHEVRLPYPSVGAFVTPNFSYEDLLTQYAIPSTANTVNLFKADQLDTIDLLKLPYKEAPVGLDQRFQPNFDLEVSLYYNQSDDVPFVIYSQLSNKYYNFDVAGALNHLPNDNDSQGLILDSLGNLYFKARDENTIRTHFAQADKFKISLKSSAPIREFSNFLDDIELDANPEDSLLYLRSNTEIYATNSENIGENCDIATILASATGIEIEITKEIVDTTTTDAIANTNAEVANTKADVATIQTELAKSLRLTNLPVPTSNTAAGTLGDMVVDGNTVYICVANDQWGKINLDFNW